MHELLSSSANVKKARIEIIPLIDVVFFLLATFVLFTLSLEKMWMIEVPLPKGGEPPKEDRVMYIEASEDGYYFWRVGRSSPREFGSLSELSVGLADYKRRETLPRVMVGGDNHARFGAAIRAMDEARKVKIFEISLETAAR